MLLLYLFLASKINTKEKRDLRYCYSWDEFYNDNAIGAKFESGTKTQVLYISRSYYIVFCSFIEFEETSIVYDTRTIENKVLLEDCLFNLNSNNEYNSNGGSFRFSFEGNCVQNRICCHSSNLPSRTVSEYKGVYCYVDTSPTVKNRFLESSVINSGKRDLEGDSTILLKDGTMKIESVNISSSQIYRNCIYRIELYDFDNMEGHISYCSFIDNNCKGREDNSYACAQIGNSESTVNIAYCNYLKNKVNSGLIAAYGPSLLMKDCCIIDNCIPGYI